MMLVISSVGAAEQDSEDVTLLKILKKLGFVETKESKDLYGPYFEMEFTSDAVVGESSAA